MQLLACDLTLSRPVPAAIARPQAVTPNCADEDEISLSMLDSDNMS